MNSEQTACTEVRVRPANPADAADASRVSAEAFAMLRSIYRPSDTLASGTGAATPAFDRLIAEDGSQVVGIVRYRIDGDLLRMTGLGVLPAWHRRGVARRLVDSLVDVGSKSACRALALYTITQTGNVSIFERLGFRVVSECPAEQLISVTGQALTEAYMERPLA